MQLKGGYRDADAAFFVVFVESWPASILRHEKGEGVLRYKLTVKVNAICPQIAPSPI